MEDTMYKEFEDLVIAAKKGAMGSKEIIVDKLTPLIIKSIRRYYNNPKEFEELLQEGKLEVLQCIENYDISRETYFIGYVQAMLKFLYLNKHKIKKTASLNMNVGEDGDGELIDLIPDDGVDIETLIMQAEMRKELYRALNFLTRRQKEVIYYFYFRKMSIKDIGELLGISYRTVVNIKVQGLEKLRKNM